MESANFYISEALNQIQLAEEAAIAGRNQPLANHLAFVHESLRTFKLLPSLRYEAIDGRVIDHTKAALWEIAQFNGDMRISRAQEYAAQLNSRQDNPDTCPSCFHTKEPA